MTTKSVAAEFARIADRYIASPPERYQTDDTGAIRHDFSQGFFDGFTSPGSQPSSPHNACYFGFLAGQEFRLAHPHDEATVMHCYGFTTVALHGRLFFGPECGFAPDTHPDARWEIADPAMPIPGWPAPPDRVDGMIVTLSGYLSPERYSAARFLGDRKIFARKVRIGNRP